MSSSHLEQFKEKNTDLYNFRCVYCGDSKKSRIKARAYLVVANDKNGYLFKCWNCGLATSFSSFLKYVNPVLYKDYVLEKFMDNQLDFESVINPTVETKKYNIKNIKIMSMNELLDDHFAKQYILNRKIPIENFNHIYFVSDFKKFMDDTFFDHGKTELKADDPRIVIFYCNMAGDISTVCGRAFSTDPTLRYVKVKVAEETKKIFGQEKLNPSLPIYLVEGEFDSMFLPNCLASGDSNLAATASWIFDTYGFKPIVVFDNEPKNKEIRKCIKNSIDAGFRTCIWPSDFPAKDINDAVLLGLTKEKIKSIIDNNSFSGLEAQLKLVAWSKS